MRERSVRPSKEFHYNGFFLDFLNKESRISHYFQNDDPAVVARKLGTPRVDRHSIADILVRQNLSFGAHPETLKAIDKLRHEDSLTVFSGQQAGLFGGPLLTLYKAIGIVKYAKHLEDTLKRPVIPIFWIAADDHDFNEINHFFWPNQQGEIARLSYDSPPAQKVPAAEMFLDNEAAYASLIEAATKGLGHTDFTDDLFKKLLDAYALNSGFVDAFGKYLLELLPDSGLVLFSPADKEVKTLSKNFFKKLAEGNFRLKELLKETAVNLEKDGYHIQAEKKETAVHLFYHDPERTALHFQDDAFVVGDKRLGLSALQDLIDKFPEKFSPDVLTRPVWQSFLFPVAAHIGGPSEIAYFAQIGKLFEMMGLVQPCYLPRPALTLIEKRYEETMEKYDFSFSNLLGDTEALVNRATAHSFPKEMEAQIAGFKAKFENAYSEFLAAVRQFDDSLEPMGKQTYGKIDFAVNAFEKKIYEQHKKKMETTRAQINRLCTAIHPNRNLQERSFNINYYISKYGLDIVDFIFKNVDISKNEHQLLYISEMGK
jgi:bacillithiol biosynthesis cysteine-adding enzyme BshC